MTDPRDLRLDNWSQLSHKTPVGDSTGPPPAASLLAPTWVPADERRRLAAYMVLAAYRANCARHHLARDATAEQRREHREYGDAALIGDRIKAGLLGDTVEFVVEGADDDLPDQPDLPDRPDDPDTDADTVTRRIHGVRLTRWETAAVETVDAWEQAVTAQPSLRARQAQLREWADRVQLRAKMDEAEGDAVHLADGVYVLWPRAGDWPEVEVYDPAGYFPVLTDTTRDYPTKVHLAWEFETTDAAGRRERWLRRYTWELVPLTDSYVLYGKGGALVWRGADGEPSDRPALAAGEQVDEQGRVYRLHPWALDPDGRPLVDDKPDPTDPTGRRTIATERRSYETCVFTDATWLLRDLDRRVDDLDESKAVYGSTSDGRIANRVDLGVDFIPVVHVPNTPASREHYGQSSLAAVAQLLDDIGAVDTDTMAAVRLSALPVVATSGANVPSELEVRPGAHYGLGPDGRMDVLDLSQGLERIMANGDRLRDLLAVNGRVPAALVGRVDASDAPSGVAIALSFGPFTQLIGTLRLTREQKYRLLLRFGQRMAQVQRVLPPGPTPPARVAFGPYLPTDRGQLVTEVTALLQAKAISTYTAVTVLVAAGFGVDDARAEVERIERENVDAAVKVADATGSERLAAERLGLDLGDEATVAPPTIDLPGGE